MTPAPSRRWFRFSLRTLFVVTAIMAVMFWGCLNWPVNEQVLFGVGGLWHWERIIDEMRERRPVASEVASRVGVCLAALVGSWAIFALTWRFLRSKKTISN